MLDVPERAVNCFESWSGMQVAFYDNLGCFIACFSKNRFYHYHKVCECVKCSGGEPACYQFDRFETLRRAWLYRDGGIKICHAGILELIMPIYSGELLAAVMVAGVRQVPVALPPGIPVLRAATVVPTPGAAELPGVSAEEIETMLEGMRQLAARLKLWFEAEPGEFPTRNTMSRAALIELMVQRLGRNELTLDDMARILHLSRSRAAHAIREATGRTLTELIMSHRLKVACSILKYTDHKIAEVARHSGFADPANFHRQFRQFIGVTPGEFRHASRLNPDNQSDPA